MPPLDRINEVNNIIVPQIIRYANCTSNSTNKYLEENPFIFLCSMIRANVFLEEREHDVKLIHVVPHSTNKEVDMPMDSQVLYSLLPKIDKDHAAFPNLINYQQNGYRFSKYLSTDGYAVSLVFYDEVHYVYGRKPKDH